jgi:hypothetical protein
MRSAAVSASRRAVASAVTVLLAVAGTAFAQFQMPDPKQMSGIPRPVTDLPDRTVSVRVIRGALSNNLRNQPVELIVGGKSQTRTTDESGRAEFGPLTPGVIVKAVTTVDGERLESQEFPAPAQGGIRLLLVATDKEKEAQAAREAAAPAVTGTLVLGGETRIVIEPDEERLRVIYLLDIVNNARGKVNPATPFQFDAPTGAVQVTLIEGSSPQANVTGTRVRVNGPFPSGATPIQVAFALPVTSGTVNLQQVFPANIEHLGVIVKKVGSASLSSPQIERQQDMPAGGQMYIAAAGGTVTAGQPVALTIGGLPHHSRIPLYLALTLAVMIVAAGFLMIARRPVVETRAAERKQLIARREKLFQDLVRLENEHRKGVAARYTARREAILAALEHIYGALDSDDGSPEPAGRPGVAA